MPNIFGGDQNDPDYDPRYSFETDEEDEEYIEEMTRKDIEKTISNLPQEDIKKLFLYMLNKLDEYKEIFNKHQHKMSLNAPAYWEDHKTEETDRNFK